MQQRHREERLADLLRSFLQARSFFFKYTEPYPRKGEIDFPRLHEFVETELFNLKEECHLMFRPEQAATPTERSSGMLFDLLVGSIFHEMMKIKENIYHLAFYAPMVNELEAKARSEKIPDFERAFIRAYKRIERRARRGLKDDLQGVIEIFHDAADNMKMLLREWRRSSLLARALVENEPLVNEAYGESGLVQLLGFMYGGDLAEGYLAAGRSFLEGGWYVKAADLFDKALAVKPDHPLAAQLKQRTKEAEAMVEELANSSRNSR